MDRDRVVRISKLLAFGLRHDPAAMGLALDSAGWASVDSVLAAISTRGEALTRDELEAIVRTSDKQRFALSEDKARIRANQGHSIAVDLGLVPREPPELLYHGTVARFVDRIRAEGLVRGARAHVHLSPDVSTAEIVARRRGAPIIVTVRAREMALAGHAFYCSENGVWLTERVPPEYLELPPIALGT